MSIGRPERSVSNDGVGGGSPAGEAPGGDHLRAARRGALGAGTIALVVLGAWILSSTVSHREAARRSRAVIRLLELSTIAFCPSGRPERHPGSYRAGGAPGAGLLPLRFDPSPSRLLVERLPAGRGSAGEGHPQERP